MKKNNPDLAINGGIPVTKEPVIIHKPFLDEADFQMVNKVIRSTFISGNGPQCMDFEKKLSEYLGVKHVLFTNSCTTALDLAFRVKGFPAGSEVIVPDFTYTSSALGPLLNNLKIVLADVNPLNGNIDINKIEKLITKKTVAIVPVDYAGNPADMDPILGIAKKHNLYVVNDTAQSIGSVYKGKKSGTMADVATFSFHATKNLTTGEGGALVTDNDELAARTVFIREKGTNKQSFLVDNRTRGFYEYVDIGSSFVQSNLLGALGITQLEKIRHISEERRRIAEYYNQELSGIPGLDFLKITHDSQTNWHLFGILVSPEEKYWIMDALRAEGVMANVHYTPLHRNKFYNKLATDEEMTGAMHFYNRLLRLPIYPSLTIRERKWVVEAVKKVFGA
jgi:dTDP-4-amino-4,6-dideoxygalactose transaminase